MQRTVKTTLANLVSDKIRVLLRVALEVFIRFRRGRFYCAALQGDSEYNISINSDLSVSCNCQDRGEGTLGNLEDAEFEAIFFGEKANLFRSELRRGKLPIITCARCSELKRLKRGETVPEARLPYRGMMLENTIGCNFACPGCIREEVLVNRKSMSLATKQVPMIAALLNALGLKKLFYFNRGEPFMSSRIREEMKLIREVNPDLHICTSTNGTLINSEDKREAALMMDEIEFSIDGCDQASVERYQKGGSFQRAYRNMTQLVELRNSRGLEEPIIEWKYLLFRWNDRPSQIRKAISLAEEAGVDLISFWPTNSPFYGLSWRYRLGLLRRVGQPSWKGREVWLNKSIDQARR